MHLALELPIAIQGLWMPGNLPFLEMNNTALIILKVRQPILLLSSPFPYSRNHGSTF